MNNETHELAQRLADFVGVPIAELGHMTSTQLRLSNEGMDSLLDAIDGAIFGARIRGLIDASQK
jgi:hypothetical protein